MAWTHIAGRCIFPSGQGTRIPVSKIIVEDNGSGFDPSDENRPHTALDNIRQRLEMMCAGKLDVMSRDGGGTMVTVTIPDQKKE